MQRIVKDVAEAIGLGDAIELVRRWGGRDLYVPVKIGRLDPLALTIGYESATKLVAAFGGQELQLPAERNALLDMRNARIAEEYTTEHRSMEDIGLRYGLSRQGVARVLRAAGVEIRAVAVAGELAGENHRP